LNFTIPDSFAQSTDLISIVIPNPSSLNYTKIISNFSITSSTINSGNLTIYLPKTSTILSAGSYFLLGIQTYKAPPTI
jgi:phage-related protein